MRIMVDLNKCIGCGACELACSQRNDGAFKISKARIRVDKGPETALRDKKFAVYVCRQCENAPCILSCPEGALSKDSATGIVRLDEGKCIGCSLCVQACPYNAIWVDHQKGKAFKCQICDQAQPACVDICPRGALSTGGGE